ncbi:MAG: hypothetical protein Q9217_002852 [Psora testacea]
MASDSKIPREIAGYTVLPLALPPLPSFPTPATHFLYVSQHQPKIPTPTSSRSIFLVNIPFDATEAHIKYLFSTQLELPAGRIEEVQFEGQRRKDVVKEEKKPGKSNKASKKRKRVSDGGDIESMEGAALPSTWDRELQHKGLTAVALFVDRSSMVTALRAVERVHKQRKQPSWGKGVEDSLPSLGFARYLHHHQLTYPNKSQLLESVNTYMTGFAAKEAAQEKLRARQRQEPDADGFIAVTRGARTNPARQEAAQELAEKQKEKQKGLEDFYRFQSREKRKARAVELMKRFEEDKEKVRKMKERRGRFRRHDVDYEANAATSSTNHSTFGQGDTNSLIPSLLSSVNAKQGMLLQSDKDASAKNVVVDLANPASNFQRGISAKTAILRMAPICLQHPAYPLPSLRIRTNPFGSNPTGTNPLGSCPSGTAYGCKPSSTMPGPYQNTSVPSMPNGGPGSPPSITIPGSPASTSPLGGGMYPPGGLSGSGVPGMPSQVPGMPSNGPDVPSNGPSIPSDVLGIPTNGPDVPTAGCPQPITVTVPTTTTVTVQAQGPPVPSAPFPIPSSPFPIPGTGSLPTGSGTAAPPGTGGPMPSAGMGTYRKRNGRH